MLPRLAVVLVLLLGATVGPARPAEAAGEILTVTAGFGGLALPGSTIPVRVRIAADRLVAGSVEATAGQTNGPTSTRVSLPVEVAGGSVKEYLMVVPTPAIAPVRLSLRLLSRAGDVVARQTVSLEAPRDEDLVGLLPAVLGGAALPGPAPLAVDAGVARFFTLDEALMGRAPQSLESLGTVGVAADGLRGLAPGARAGLLRWVGAGGRLLVDAAPGAAVDGLPAAWQPAGDGRARAGRGEIVETAGAMAAGRWAGLVEPTLRGKFGESFIAPRELVSQSLAQDAGLSTRGPGWLMGFLVLYVLVAGPVTFVVLRRRRREELAWVAVPLVALLFAAGSYVEGRRLRAAGDAHASVIVSAPDDAGGSTAFSYVGLIARRTQTARVGLPAGWSVRVGAAPYEEGGGGTLGVATTRSGQAASLPLNSGQLGVVLASGPVSAGSGLAVTAEVKDGKLSGVVRNGTPFRVEKAAVVVGTRATSVGTLGAGEERAWTMDGEAALPTGDPLLPVLWPGMPFGDQDVGPASYGLWQALQAIVGRDEPAPGEATAVAWTRDFRPQFVVNGRSERPAGRTMLLATSAFRYQSGPLPSLAVARDQVRGAGAVAPGMADMSSGGPSVVRFELPAGAKPGRLVLRTLNGASVDVWRDGAWRSIDYGTLEPVDDATLPGFDMMQPGFPGPMMIPPKAAFDLRRGDGPGLVPGSTVVDYELPPPAGRVVYLRVQTADGVAAVGSYTWVREATS